MPKLDASSSLIRNSIILGLITLIVFFAFASILQGEFLLWDDDVHIFKNIAVQTLDYEHLKDIFTSTVNYIYIPLTTLTFAIEYHFFGSDPFAYHLNNLILHLGIVVLIYWLGLRIGLSSIASGVGALIFGIHPMHVESVAWITERKDVLYTFFYMGALVSYSFYLDFLKSTQSLEVKKKYRFLILATVFGILSMLAKPMALSLPLILLLMDWFHRREWSREVILEKVPMGIAIAGITLITYVTHARVPGNSIYEGALIWCWTLVFYLKQFILPITLVPIYQLPRPILPYNPEYVVALIGTALFIFSIIRFRKHRWFIFACAFYFFSIFFLLRYDDAKDANVVADRFMYLPSLGFCYLIGYGCQKLLEQKQKIHSKILLIALVAVVAVLTYQTRGQVKIWDNSLSLWKHQLKHYPEEIISLNNYAATLREQDDFKEAENVYRQVRYFLQKDPEFEVSDEAKLQVDKVEYVLGIYQRAISIDRNSVVTYNHLGNMLKDLLVFPEAIQAYKETLKIDHKNKDAHFSLGELYQEIGDYKQAIYAYDQALQYNPGDEDVYVAVISGYNDGLANDPEIDIFKDARNRTMEQFTELIRNKEPKATSYFNLGFLYGGMKDYKSALSAYQMALDINPRHAKALYNMANVYRDAGQFKDAIAMYQRVISINSRSSDAYMNLGTIYERQGKRELAKEHFVRAFGINPQNARNVFNMGLIEEKAGKLSRAIELYEKSIKLDSSNKEAYYNLGNCFARLGNHSKAIEMYKKSIKLDNRYDDALVNLSTISFKEGDYAGAVKYCDEAVLLGYVAPQGYLKALAPHRNK